MNILTNVKSGIKSAGCWIKDHSKQILIGAAAIGGSILAIGIAGALSDDCDCDCVDVLIPGDDPDVEIETTVEVEVQED